MPARTVRPAPRARNTRRDLRHQPAARRQPGVDPAQAVVSDHDRLSRSVQGAADEFAKVTVSLRQGAPPQPSLWCLDGQRLSRLRQRHRNWG